MPKGVAHLARGGMRRGLQSRPRCPRTTELLYRISRRAARRTPAGGKTDHARHPVAGSSALGAADRAPCRPRMANRQEVPCANAGLSVPLHTPVAFLSVHLTGQVRTRRPARRHALKADSNCFGPTRRNRLSSGMAAAGKAEKGAGEGTRRAHRPGRAGDNARFRQLPGGVFFLCPAGRPGSIERLLGFPRHRGPRQGSRGRLGGSIPRPM